LNFLTIPIRNFIDYSLNGLIAHGFLSSTIRCTSVCASTI
jgi:hypothetical protein